MKKMEGQCLCAWTLCSTLLRLILVVEDYSVAVCCFMLCMHACLLQCGYYPH